MEKSMKNYSHILEIDEERKLLVINRVFEDGKRQLFTSIDLPGKTFSEDEQGFREFAQKLGENLLLDSPVARRLFGL